MSRYAVVDKGRINGYATYLLLIGVLIGFGTGLATAGHFPAIAFFVLPGFALLYYLEKVYADIEAIQDDFVENQRRYLSTEEFEGLAGEQGVRFGRLGGDG